VSRSNSRSGSLSRSDGSLSAHSKSGHSPRSNLGAERSVFQADKANDDNYLSGSFTDGSMSVASHASHSDDSYSF
jgi:hypothetical protein